MYITDTELQQLTQNASKARSTTIGADAHPTGTAVIQMTPNDNRFVIIDGFNKEAQDRRKT